MIENQSLITKYRPATFQEVLGHDSVMSALSRHIASNTHSHGYLLTGPSGVGKTTVARLVADYFHAELTDYDAAEHTGIDDIRQMKEQADFRSMSGNGNKLILIDECHALSANAWKALLKILEEPPEHLFFALCTTEFNKVPDTIVQRCYHVVLRPVHIKIIEDLIDMVVRQEGWKVPGNILTMVADAATGQPRKALALLQAGVDAQSPEELQRIIELQEASGAVLDIARAFTKSRPDWETVRRLFPRIGDDEFEHASGALGRYILAVMVNSDEKRAKGLWVLLDALTFPAASYDKKVLFMNALGRMIWGA